MKNIIAKKEFMVGNMLATALLCYSNHFAEVTIEFHCSTVDLLIDPLMLDDWSMKCTSINDRYFTTNIYDRTMCEWDAYIFFDAAFEDAKRMLSSL